MIDERPQFVAKSLFKFTFKLSLVFQVTENSILISEHENFYQIFATPIKIISIKNYWPS